VKADEQKAAPEIGPRGSETVLLVEDEEVVRGLATHILQDAGYKVLAARGGAEAIQLCTQPAEKIDLLLTDVVMPETSGKEVAERVTALVPPPESTVHVRLHRRGDCPPRRVGFERGIYSETVHATGSVKKVREVLDSQRAHRSCFKKL